MLTNHLSLINSLGGTFEELPPLQQQSSRRLNQLVGGKDTICRKHNQNREPKCNFIITTLSRSNKAVNDTKEFTIPRNSVFIAVNDCWATQDYNPNKVVMTGSENTLAENHGGLGVSDENSVAGAVVVSNEKKKHRQPVVKAESLPQYSDKPDSIERKSSQRRSSNESCSISKNLTGRVCYATFSKGMYKQQHIYENDCIIQKQTPVSVRDSTPLTTNPSVQPLIQNTDISNDAHASGDTNPPLYAVINKNNKSKNKQTNELIASVAAFKHQHVINDNNIKAIIIPAATPSNNLFLSNNNNNSSNNNIKLLKSINHPSLASSDIMGNMLQTEAAVLDGNCDVYKEQKQLDFSKQGDISNKIPLSLLSTTQTFDPTITTTTITADMRSDSNAEHSIYAKVWKGPRKTSESKMYDI